MVSPLLELPEVGASRDHAAYNVRLSPEERGRPEASIGKGEHPAIQVLKARNDLFGVQGSYLIDFYHVCEYQGAAAKTIVPDPAAGKAWMEAQEDALKMGRVGEVLSIHRQYAMKWS